MEQVTSREEPLETFGFPPVLGQAPPMAAHGVAIAIRLILYVSLGCQFKSLK